MAQWVKRSAAGIGAIVFLVTSLSLTFLVIWSLYQQNQQKKKEEALTKSLQENQEGKLQGTQLANFTPIATVDSLQKIDTTPGSGDEVKTGDTITAHYTGALAKDGKIFESSLDSGQPATFSLSGVIEGWQQGVPGMKVGGTRRLIIPASMAYGEAGSPPAIGPNEPLVFDIQLIKIGE